MLLFVSSLVFATACERFHISSDTEIVSSTVSTTLSTQTAPVETCCEACFADVTCGGFTEYLGVCYFKGGSINLPSSTFNLTGRNGYLKKYIFDPPSPPLPASPPRPPISPTPPGGHFKICDGPCDAFADELASGIYYNWLVSEEQTLHVRDSWTAGDVRVRGRLIIEDVDTNITLSASRILIEGNGMFRAGNKTNPYLSSLTILLRTSDEFPEGTGLLEADGGGSGLPRVEIYGVPMSRSWSLLSRPALPSDTKITLQDNVSDWKVGDKVVVGGWAPGRGKWSDVSLLYPSTAGNTGLNTLSNTLDISKGDGHIIGPEERAALIRSYDGDIFDHAVTHCNASRCCRYDEVVNEWDCSRPHVPENLLPCKELRKHIPTPSPTDEDGFVCCVLAAKGGSVAATCGDVDADDCGGVCTWNINPDTFQWHLAEQARQCASYCMRHTGSGISEERTIEKITSLTDGKVILTLNEPLANTHPGGETTFSAPTGTFSLSTSAEVLRLTRNIRITGENHISVKELGSNEAAFRASTQLTGAGQMNIEGVELDHCGKQTHAGRYCLHFHLSGNCRNCTFSHNAVHHTFQRGITVHGTHYSTVEDNAIYEARGANIYMEDGNEFSNYILSNAATGLTWHSCKISPTHGLAQTDSNRITWNKQAYGAFRQVTCT